MKPHCLIVVSSRWRDVLRLRRPLLVVWICALALWGGLSSALAQSIIVDHTCTRLADIPASAITEAKSRLHIAYGHTSHGSQLIDGMEGLVTFMNRFPNDAYADDLFAFNSGGIGGALDLRDTPFSGANDLGAPNRTAWSSATRTYLATNPTVNVIIWSWCGQVDGSQADIQSYLDQMSALERDYPQVKFVYMTGHLNGGGAAGNVNVRNNQIRAYCRTNNKILYDFADIESYGPGGTTNYMELFANDNCDYDSDGNGSLDRNWATDWQTTHTQNVDWYACSAAHSQALNGNRKAYAAWYLWARLAGWSGSQTTDTTAPSTPGGLTATVFSPTKVQLVWTAATDAVGVTGYRIYRDGSLVGTSTTTSYIDTGLQAGSQHQYTVVAYDAAGNLSVASAVAPATTVDEPSVFTALSVRGRVGTGDQTLIMGLAFTGGATKSVFLRGVGPAMSESVPGYLRDPAIALFNGQSVKLQENNNWSGASDLAAGFARVGLSPLGNGAADAALQTDLPAGPYTLHLTDAGATGGIVLGEVYDGAPATTSTRLAAFSVRNQVGLDDDILIVGFVISQPVAKQVLIRGLGPALEPNLPDTFLADPQLELFRYDPATRTSTSVASNDNWGGDAGLSAAFSAVGMGWLAADSADAALVVILPPGIYTAHVRGANSTTGVGLVEIYEMP